MAGSRFSSARRCTRSRIEVLRLYANGQARRGPMAPHRGVAFHQTPSPILLLPLPTPPPLLPPPRLRFELAAPAENPREITPAPLVKFLKMGATAVTLFTVNVTLMYLGLQFHHLVEKRMQRIVVIGEQQLQFFLQFAENYYEKNREEKVDLINFYFD